LARSASPFGLRSARLFTDEMRRSGASQSYALRSTIIIIGSGRSTMESKVAHPRRRREKYTIGLDLGDRNSRYCVLDNTGVVIEEGSLKTSPVAMRAHFTQLPHSRIAIEVGAHSRWVNILLNEEGHEVIVANPRNVQLISASTRKTDKVDAHTLARLARVDPSLLSPVRHRSVNSQSHLAIIRARNALVTARTQLINCLRGMVKSTGERLPPCSSESFAAKAAEHIPNALKLAAGPLLQQIASLTEQIKAYDRTIEQIADSEHPETIGLRTVPGVGALTALTFVLTLEDPSRFERSRDVECKLRLPSETVSVGAKCPAAWHFENRRLVSSQAARRECSISARKVRFRLCPS